MQTVSFYLGVTDNVDKWTEHVISNQEIHDLFLVLLWLCRVTADKLLVCSVLQLSHLSVQIMRLTFVETAGRD